jgi:Mlc titration factor MtfA (ptsG expression regulator)
MALIESSALFAALEPPARDRLRVLAADFLARKTFTAAAGHVLTGAQTLAIAALAVLPLLGLELERLPGWREVIVYPGGFRVRREHHDDATGVITEGHDDLIGEAWERGPLILSWADVAADLAAPFEGFNVVVHEIAHKLDLLDGGLDGVPRLPRTISRGEWLGVMQAAFDAHVRAVDRGRHTAIDPYAAENPEEYFAVASELHFSDPATLARAAPDVAALLARYYGPSPAARTARA